MSDESIIFNIIDIVFLFEGLEYDKMSKYKVQHMLIFSCNFRIVRNRKLSFDFLKVIIEKKY